jgi:uncharacterized protein YbjT (DUF2867 family)
MKRVFSVQNWMTSGVEGEARQGKLVADVARSAGVEHLVYASARTGDTGTGLAYFDSKVEVEAYLREQDLPNTTIRPGPFRPLLRREHYCDNSDVSTHVTGPLRVLGI